MRMFQVCLTSLALAVATPALAQTLPIAPAVNIPGAATSTTVDPLAHANRNEHYDFGWLGLLGLIGLAGLMRGRRHDVPGTAHSVSGTGTRRL